MRLVLLGTKVRESTHFPNLLAVLDASREVLCGQSAVDVPETDDSLVVANQEELGVGRTHLQALDATRVRRLRQAGEN